MGQTTGQQCVDMLNCSIAWLCPYSLQADQLSSSIFKCCEALSYSPEVSIMTIFVALKPKSSEYTSCEWKDCKWHTTLKKNNETYKIGAGVEASTTIKYDHG